MSAVDTTIAGRRGWTALRLLTAGSLAAMLAGCYHSTVAQDNNYPVDYRQRHPITLQNGVHSVDVFIGRSRGGLNPSQRADVVAFAQTWRRESTSGIAVDAPAGGPASRAVAASLREIYSILAASGVPRNVIYTRRHSARASSLAIIKLNYTMLTATAGPCGLWPKDIGPGGGDVYIQNQPYWNFGCATQRNLAAMVANPADLVQPRAEASAYEARRSVMIDKYRKGEFPSGTYTGYDQGKISDLGK
jgi:pilus assembly protein CpaD